LIAPIDDLNIENAIKEQVYKIYFKDSLWSINFLIFFLFACCFFLFIIYLY
jgi:hypothetical protein